MPDSSDETTVLKFDVFELDVRAGELRKRGTRLRIHGQPLQVLAVLLKRAGDVVTRKELRSEIWPADTFVDFDHSLHNAIARVRETLGDSADKPRYIETLPRRGYRFICRVDGIKAGTAIRGFVGDGSQLSRPQMQALAVLPLENLSGMADQDYFADGMTEALITSLAKLKALRVISRTSAMRYKGARKTLPQIARELNVDAVIEGSVLRSGQRVRITAQLIHAATDQHLWAESYERDLRDILSLQSEIARQIANQVRIVLTPEEQSHFDEIRQVKPEAHEFYLKGRYYWNKRTEESVRKALSFFHRAIDQDPGYAQGYAGLADSYNILGYYNALAPVEAYPKARAAASRALELDHSLSEARAALGVVKRDFEWDWDGAEKNFQEAIQCNPGYVEAHHWRSTLLAMLGRQSEALREKTRALAMDPLSVVIRSDVARMHYFARDYDQAIQEYLAAIDMDPNFALAHIWLGQVYQQKAWFDEAIAELEAGRRLSGDSPYARARMGYTFAVAGKHKEALALREQMTSHPQAKYVSPYDVALIHVGLGENEEAFDWLHKALEQRSLWLGYLSVEPQLDSLRPDARFQELRRRVGLPD